MALFGKKQVWGFEKLKVDMSTGEASVSTERLLDLNFRAEAKEMIDR